MVLGELAADQFGLVTSAQARAYGVDAVTLHRLREADLIRQVGYGVYQIIGAVEPTHLDIRVAWLRLDPARPAWERNGRGARDGVVSHGSACLVHQLGDIPVPNVELTVPGRLTARDPWVVLHRHPGPLPAADITTVDGLPVTTPERTILDLLSAGTDGGHIGGVIADAERRRILDLAELADRARPLAARYSMPRASGMELLARLAAEAGHRLEAEQAGEVIAETAASAYAAGQVDAISRLIEARLRAEGWKGSDALTELLAPMRNALAHHSAMPDTLTKMSEAIETQLAPFKSAAERLTAAQLSPAVLELHRHLTTVLAPYRSAAASFPPLLEARSTHSEAASEMPAATAADLSQPADPGERASREIETSGSAETDTTEADA